MSARKGSWFASLFAVAVLAGSTAAGAEIYRNEQWGVSFPYPTGLADCVGTYYGTDHGPIMFLDPSASQLCDGDRHRRAISMFNVYNIVQRTATLPGLLEFACEEKCTATPGELRFPGLKSLSGRSNHSDGWIEIVVVAHPGEANLEDSFINYTLSLHTDRAHLETDFRTLRSVLDSMAFTTPK